MTEWLQCASCGEDMFESDADGMFGETAGEPCGACSVICWISVDDHGHGPTATVSTDWDCGDVGQPRCDGDCGFTIHALASESLRTDTGVPPYKGPCPDCGGRSPGPGKLCIMCRK